MFISNMTSMVVSCVAVQPQSPYPSSLICTINDVPYSLGLAFLKAEPAVDFFRQEKLAAAAFHAIDASKLNDDTSLQRQAKPCRCVLAHTHSGPTSLRTSSNPSPITNSSSSYPATPNRARRTAASSSSTTSRNASKKLQNLASNV